MGTTVGQILGVIRLKGGNEMVKSFKSATKRMKQEAFNLRSALQGAFGIYMIRDFNRETNLATNAMLGLQSVAEFKGVQGAEAAVQDLQMVKDGLIDVADASMALKNLLLRYGDLDTAIKIMNRLGEAASFGRQGQLSFGEAIVGATEGLKNENSIMVDNAGVTKNISVMWKEYAATLGKGAMSLNDVEKQQAEVKGIMKETLPFVGNMTKLINSEAGEQMKFNATWKESKILFGQIIQIFNPLVTLGRDILQWVNNSDQSVRNLVASGFMMLGMIKLVKIALIGLNVSMGPAGWLITGLTLAATAFGFLQTQTKGATKELSKFNQQTDHILSAGFIEYYRRMFKDLSMEQLAKKRQGVLKRLKTAEEYDNKELVTRYNGAVTAISRLIDEKKQKVVQASKEELQYQKKVVDYQYEFGEISLEKYLQHLRKRQQAFKKHSVEYLDIEYQIKELINTDREERETEESNYLKTKNDLEYQYSEISLEQYIQHLEQRKKAFKENSAEFLELEYQIREIRRQSEQEDFNYQRSIMQSQFQDGDIGLDSYWDFLNERLSGLEEHSAEYQSIWQKMNAIILQDQRNNLNRMKSEWQSYVSSVRTVGQNIAQIVTDTEMSGGKKWKQIGKQMLLAVVDILDKKLWAAKLSAALKGIINWGTFVKNAPKILAAEVGLAGLRGAITAMAEGAVVTKPTLALIGERSVAGSYVPEVVAPQDKFEDFARNVVAQVSGSGNTSSRNEVSVVQNFNTPLQDKRMAQKMTDSVLKPQMERSLKRGGRFVNQDAFKK